MKAFESRHELVCMSICYVLPKHLKRNGKNAHRTIEFIVCVQRCWFCFSFYFYFLTLLVRSSIAGINGFNGIYFLYWCNFFFGCRFSYWTFSGGLLLLVYFFSFFFGWWVYSFYLTLVLRFSLFYGKVCTSRFEWRKGKYYVTCSADCSSITIFTSRLCFASKNARRCFVSPKK